MTTPSDETSEIPKKEGDEPSPESAKETPTGEVPVVRSTEDVPFEVLEELTQAFDVVIGEYEDDPTLHDGDVFIDGHDLIPDSELTRASPPPLIIRDDDFTAEFTRGTAPPEPDRRFRLRRIAVKREEGRKRLRLLAYVAIPLAGVALVLGVLASPIFGVRNITVDGTQYSSTEILEEAKSIIDGKSIFSVDLHAAEELLRTDPWIRDARASRHFPSTVSFEIDERTPVAWFVGGDNQSRVIDVDGKVISVQVGQPTAYLHITGVGDTVAAGGQANEAFTAAAQVAASIPDEIRGKVLNLGVVNGTDLLMTLRSGTTVVFGRPVDLRAKLVSLVLVLRRQDPKNLRSIDLSSGDPIIAVK
jgi:cell division protein FtsQ